jgi:thiamine pyrophosphate-dependent acetolactate synthase large subunit-like protein
MAAKARGGIDRRTLFKGAVAGASAIPAAALSAAPAAAQPAPSPSRPAAAEPTAAALARESAPPRAEPGAAGRSGGDYMVDAIKQLDIPYVACMAGSSFRGLHESLINYGQNTRPEMLTCLHEEISVGLAHGYAKATGKPLIALLHGTVGIQHAAMAIYNAWCDRVPVLLIGGNALDGTKRRTGVEWNHSVLDQGATIRDFTKWDAQPLSLLDFNESLKRGYQLAASAPAGPVLIMADGDLQEDSIAEDLRPEPLLAMPIAPIGDLNAVDAAARRVAAASSPVIVVDRMVRSQAGMDALVQLAELLQAPVIDRMGRLNMPTTHYLCQTELGRAHVRTADAILGLELSDPYGTLNDVVDVDERYSQPVAAKGAHFIQVSTRDLLVKGNYQDFQRYQPSELAITGDAEATLPHLIEAVRRAQGANGKGQADARKSRLEAGWRDMKQRARVAATYGWDASPISTGRFCAELHQQLQGHDWVLTGGGGFISSWPNRLWALDRHGKYIGGSGGGGVGYGGPAGVGVALACKGQGKIPVNILGDGELLCCPTSLWTAAHHQIPTLFVVHNNRAYHQELMHLQRVGNRRGRGVTRAHIGTTIDTPDIDFAAMARSFGCVGIGPISDPKALAPAFKRAVEAVKAGEPVLVDVVAQPR